jgi:cation:H+ antiporter
MMTYILLLLGFVALIVGADLLVKGGANIAHKYKVSEMTIGLTIVSFGTSMPELVVSFSANLDGHANLAIANILGSNTMNVLLILGLAAIIRPLPVNDATVVSEIPFSLAAILLVGFLANAALFSPGPELAISRLDGAILLFFFVLFMAYVYKTARGKNQTNETEHTPTVGLTRSILLVAGGLFGLYQGGRWVVDGSVKIASGMGISETMIGLTVVAIGTSLPELFASAVAAYRGKTDIAVGNVVGSNIFNLLWILGATALIAELPFDAINNTDLAMVVFATALVIVAVALGRKSTIHRWHGVAFMLIYAAYLTYVVDRG